MDLIDEILDNVKTIAVVGLSDNPAPGQQRCIGLYAVPRLPHHSGEPGA